MGIKISEATPVSSVAGTELFPASAAGNPRSVSASQLKTYLLAQIAAIEAGTAVTGADGVYVLQGGAMKPVDIDLIAQHAIDTVWGKAAQATAAAGNVLPLKDGTTEKTVALSVLAEYVRTAIEATILDISDIGEATSLADSDMLLVTQGTTGKRVDLDVLVAKIYASLATYIAALTEVTTAADSDEFIVVRSGVNQKVPLSKIKAVLGDWAIPPASTTENKIPQWSATSKTLKDGLTLLQEVRPTGNTDASSVPSETAARGMANTLVYLQSDIGEALADADTIVVDKGNVGTTQRKSALSRVWTYIKSKLAVPSPSATVTEQSVTLRGDVVVAAKDESGASIGRQTLLRVWISDSDLGAPDDSGNTVVISNGTAIHEVEANAHYIIQTDAAGEAELQITLSGADDRYVMVEWCGKIVSAEVSIAEIGE